MKCEHRPVRYYAAGPYSYMCTKCKLIADMPPPITHARKWRPNRPPGAVPLIRQLVIT